MSRFTGLFAGLVFAFTTAWAQAPASQTGAPGAAPAAQSGAPSAAPEQAAPTSQAGITGCMTQWFGQFNVADPGSSKSWEIRGNGATLWNHENHVVTVQGLPDPKAPSPTIYAQSVQDTGQPCGNAQASNAAAAQPGAAPSAQPGTAQGQPPTASGSTANAPTGGTTGATAGATTGTSPAPTNTNPNGSTPEPQQQPGGGLSQPGIQPQPPQTSAPQQGGVSGAATGSSMTAQSSDATENKGVPTAGTPQNTGIASNSAQQQPAANNQIFNGCLTGSVNNYQFKADGKTYRLQGNTSSLNSMVNHQVEVTGENFNDKAIQVNGARDLGGNCKGK